MAFITNITGKFWDYVSPRKTQQRRDKEFKFKVPALPQRHKQEGESSRKAMSPDSRIHSWGAHIPFDSIYADDPQLPPSPSSLERPYTDFEGDTLIDELADTLNQDPKDDWDANEETVVVDVGRYVDEHKEKDAQHELERRENQGRELRAAGWTEDAIFLFQKLGMRGFEPLLPYTWFEDFTMLPADLFTRNMDKAFIKPMSDKVEYHAYRALDDLLGLGGRVRDAVLQKATRRTAETRICRAILNYNKWALKDGKVSHMWKDISLFSVVSCPKNVSSKIAEARMLRKLNKRAALWRDAFRERQMQDPNSPNSEYSAIDYGSGPDLPTLYGVVACHTIMAFVSYDVHATTPLLRTVAMFDLGQEGYDVWNSLAIAIFVIHCRNRLIQLKDSLPEPEYQTTDTDPDA